jgi:RHS repeat-associated protein
VRDNLVRVFEDKRYAYDGHGRLIQKLSGKHTKQSFQWDDEHRLMAIATTRRPNTEEATTQTIRFDYDAIGRRVAKHDAFGSTRFIWEGMRLIEERRGQSVVTYVYEPNSYVPLARIDASGQPTGAGGVRTTSDALPPEVGAVDAAADDDTSSPDSKNTTSNIYYFHTDQVGLPEELSDSEGSIRWRASYKTWGSAVSESWEAVALNGDSLNATAYAKEAKPLEVQQNLRFQGQYLDRESGLHYNTFRFYDPDIGRFISPDPIGLWGGENLHSYSPNPVSWVDPLGLETRPNNGQYNIFHDYTVPASNRYSSDGVQFNRANADLVGKMNTNPAFRRDMLGRYPELGEWMKTGNRAGSPAGLTWHHHENTGRLVLVDRIDHGKNHGLYHPTGKGGRDMWGGGKPGRTGKLNGATGKPC